MERELWRIGARPPRRQIDQRKPASMMPSATVCPITEPDLDAVADFLQHQVQPGEMAAPGAMPPRRRLRWLLLANPARADEIPLGWQIRSEGHVVGAAICVPFHAASARWRGTALMFCKWFVDAPFRGMGAGLLMRFVREGARYPLLTTSTNAASGELFSRVGARRIGGMDHTMLGIWRSRPLAEEWFFRRTARQHVSRIVSLPAILIPPQVRRRKKDRRPTPASAAAAVKNSSRWLANTEAASSPGDDRLSGVEPSSDVGIVNTTRSDIEEMPLSAARPAELSSERGPLVRLNADEAARLELPLPRMSIAVVRDAAYLRWRYFGGESEKDVFRFSLKGHPDRLVVVGLARAGYRGQIRVANVLDLWPAADQDCIESLVSALADHYRGQFDAIWLRSQSAAVEERLAALGWRRHDFPAPLGWCVDRGNRLGDAPWYLMPGESE